MTPEQIKTERLNRGLSIRQAATQIGVSPRNIREAESGGPMPHPANAKKIADFFGVTVTEIWPLDVAA